ncbi:MAG: restriction endonuclease subunit S, partial [Dysgonamonadaceae bacterium]|nr:restriction endonuclease subunit S [Dysgonamonadaceae bacterium]
MGNNWKKEKVKYLRVDEIVRSISITHKFDKPKLKFLNTSDVEKGKVININELPTDELKGQAKKTIKKDDILFSEIRPKNGRYAYIDFDDTEDFVVSTKLMVLRKFAQDVDNKYFYYWLTNDAMLQTLQERAENRICSFPQITFDLLSEYKVPIPNIDTQRRIAAILSCLDEKIALNNRINDNLEAMAKTLYEYWFVQNRGKDWEVEKLGNLGEFKNGANYEKANTVGEKIKIVNVRNISASSIFIGTDNLDEITLSRKEIEKYLLNENDVVIARSGIPGATRLIENTNEDIIYCGFAIRFRLRDKKLKEFIYFSLKQNEEAAKNQSGGSIMPNISQDSLKDVEIYIPDSDTLVKFQKIIRPIFALLTKNNRECATFTTLRDYLLPL